jgi:hypothetical protein
MELAAAAKGSGPGGFNTRLRLSHRVPVLRENPGSWVGKARCTKGEPEVLLGETTVELDLWSVAETAYPT